MLGIILPLVAIPMIVLGTVGYVASAGQAETTGSRYLNERSNDLQTVSENPSIRDYFDNRYYGLAEEAEVYRRDLERSLARLADRINRNELIYRQIRYIDDQGREIAKIVDGAIDQNREDLSNSQIFQPTRKLPPGEMYRSPTGPLMTFAIPVYETSASKQSPDLLGAVVLDFVYPIEDFKRSARYIANSFFHYCSH